MHPVVAFGGSGATSTSYSTYILNMSTGNVLQLAKGVWQPDLKMLRVHFQQEKGFTFQFYLTDISKQPSLCYVCLGNFSAYFINFASSENL